MENGNHLANQLGSKWHGARIWFMAATLALVSTLSAGRVLHAQSAPPAPPTPQASAQPPEPPGLPGPADPPDPFDLPDPPLPPGAPEIYVLNDGSVHLGVALDDVTADKAHELKLPTVAGALVTEVQKGSAAEKAGLQTGDVISDFDGVHVRSSAELRRLVRETPAGRTVEIKVVRAGESHTVSAKLEAPANRPNYIYKRRMAMPGPQFFAQVPPPIMGPRVTLGIQGDDLTQQLAEYFGVNQGAGVLVFEVTLGGAANKAGLKAGDVITQVDGKPVHGVDDLRRALIENFSGDTRKVNLTIIRDHHERTMTAELTRAKVEEEHTLLNIAPEIRLDRAGLPAAMQELRAQADNLQSLSEVQRALIQSEVLQQQKYLQKEWQQQLHSMKGFDVQKPQPAAHHDDKI